MSWRVIAIVFFKRDILKEIIHILEETIEMNFEPEVEQADNNSAIYDFQTRPKEKFDSK